MLNRVVSLFRRRSFNIESLTVGHSEIPGVSRMTIVVAGDDAIIEQVVKQLYKLIDVIKVSDLSDETAVQRELALVKVNATASTRAEIMQIVDIYRAKIVDVAADSLMIEITGTEDKIDSLIELLRRFGIKEIVRTGRVAMMRGAAGRHQSRRIALSRRKKNAQWQRMYYDADADLGLLKGKKIAVIGYGSQGHAHALNLKDSGLNVDRRPLQGQQVLGAAPRGRPQGRRPSAEAAQEADVIMMLVPDQTQKRGLRGVDRART